MERAKLLEKTGGSAGNPSFIKRLLEPFPLFLLVSLTGTALFFILLPFLGVHGMDWFVMENNGDYESADYFLPILFSAAGKDAYSFGVDACYSPLAYGLFYLFGSFTGLPSLLDAGEIGAMSYAEKIAMSFELLVSPYQLLVYLLYLLAGLLPYLFALDELGLRTGKRRLLAAAVLFSLPMLGGALERGNLTLYVAGFALLSAALREKESRIFRAAALLLIGIAAGMKFYPAVLGLLYLKEKRFREAVILIVLGLFFVFAPFAFFGGLDGVRGLLENLSALSSEVSYYGRIQFFQGIVSVFGISGRMAAALSLLFGGGLVLLCLLTKSRVRTYTFLAALMAMFPPNAYRYTLLFFLLPLFFWIRDEGDKRSKVNTVRAVLYGCIFTIPSIPGLASGFHLNLGVYTLTCAELFVYVSAWGLLFFEAAGALREAAKTAQNPAKCSQ